MFAIFYCTVCTVQTDLLGEEGISSDEKKLLLNEHHQFCWVISCLGLLPQLLHSTIFH